MTTEEAFKIWREFWEKENSRDNGWFPTPSTVEAFYAGFEAAQKILPAPKDENSKS